VPSVRMTTNFFSPILGAAWVRTKRPSVMPPYENVSRAFVSRRIEITHPEASCHITDFGRVTVTIVDEVRDEPARNAHFGALVSEDEERPKDGDPILQSKLEVLQLGCSLISSRLPAHCSL
jgi:hypothetical protein